MKVGQEISVEIEAGKTLFIRLVNIGAVDAEGKRAVNFELNGMARQLAIVDRSAKPTVKARVKADAAKPAEIGAPIPGPGHGAGGQRRRQGGERRQAADARSHENADHDLRPADGVVDEICVQNGDAVESKDLILKLRAA